MMLAGRPSPNEIVGRVRHRPRPGRGLRRATRAPRWPTPSRPSATQVDAVFVCTWTSAHHDAVAIAVAAGKAVFCEKPLAPDLAQAEALCALVDGSRRDQPGRAGPAPFAGLHPGPPAAGRPGCRPGHGGGPAGRPVHPHPGHVRLRLAGRPGQGGGRDRDRALHPRRRPPRVAPGSDRPGQCLDPGVPRHRRHRGRGHRELLVRLRRGRLHGVGLARRPGAAQPAPRRDPLRAAPRHGRGRLVRAGALDPDRAGRAGARGADLLAALDPALPEGGNPDGEFLAAVAEGRPASPDVGEALRAHRVVDALYRSAAADGTPVAP